MNNPIKFKFQNVPRFWIICEDSKNISFQIFKHKHVFFFSKRKHNLRTIIYEFKNIDKIFCRTLMFRDVVECSLKLDPRLIKSHCNFF